MSSIRAATDRAVRAPTNGAGAPGITVADARSDLADGDAFGATVVGSVVRARALTRRVSGTGGSCNYKGITHRRGVAAGGVARIGIGGGARIGIGGGERAITGVAATIGETMAPVPHCHGRCGSGERRQRRPGAHVVRRHHPLTAHPGFIFSVHYIPFRRRPILIAWGLQTRTSCQ